MPTNKKMQLKILDKMRENIIEGKHLLSEIEYYSEGFDKWNEIKQITKDSFLIFKHRVKPESIKVNGVEIPKPLSHDELDDYKEYFHVCNDRFLYEINSGIRIKDYGIKFVYKTKEEAIKASKILFGIK